MSGDWCVRSLPVGPALVSIETSSDFFLCVALVGGTGVPIQCLTAVNQALVDLSAQRGSGCVLSPADCQLSG